MESKGKLIDLSHTLENDVSLFPGMEAPKIIGHKKNNEHGYYMISDIHINSHHGTHMDAPCHFVEDTRSVDQIPIEQCYGRGRVISLINRSMDDV
jgi:arylformamidase